MMAVKRLFTGWRWTLPLLVLGVNLWLTLFCRSAVPIGALESLRALLPGPPVSLAQALVLNLRLPRSLVAMLLGASLALAGSLLQTLTRNPLASPSLFGINAGASLAMVVVSALSPQLFSGFSIALVAAVGGGVSWGAVMLMGGGWQQAGDRSRVDPRGCGGICAVRRAGKSHPDPLRRPRLRHSQLAGRRCGARPLAGVLASVSVHRHHCAVGVAARQPPEPVAGQR